MKTLCLRTQETIPVTEELIQQFSDATGGRSRVEVVRGALCVDVEFTDAEANATNLGEFAMKMREAVYQSGYTEPVHIHVTEGADK